MVQILGKDVGETGFGLMGFTWRPNPMPATEAYLAMKAALTAGCTFWNGGDFYGTPEYNSLHLLAGYFEKYPEDAAKVTLSIKSGIDVSIFKPDGTPKFVRDRINNANKLLGGKKKIDIFEYARVPTNVDFFNVTLKELEKCVDEGLIGGIGLSEVSAETVKKAVAVTKIAACEVELSLWSTDILTNGVADACGEAGVPIVAYSPIGRGMLTGQIRSVDDIPKDDMRRGYPRFLPENFHLNIKLVERLEAVAEKRGCTTGQLALAWVRQAGRNVKGNPEIIPIPGATTAARVEENSKVVSLDDATLAEIGKILSEIEVVGTRYPEHLPVEG